jgi:N-acetylneuraminic acid mutarotase
MLDEGKRWLSAGKLPFPISEAAFATVGDEAFLIGGYSPDIKNHFSDQVYFKSHFLNIYTYANYIRFNRCLLLG